MKRSAAEQNWQPLEDLVPAEIFKAEVRAWARRIGVEPREIHIRPMKRKWGSCSSRGRLTFNRELLRQPARMRAEVIIHELLHLKIPNHGRIFRALLRAYLAQLGEGGEECWENGQRRLRKKTSGNS
ncbi:M48 family metallopeptidase [Thermus tengchongensis]|uniref:M48 metallopeptidase family protein n=1 Tax=Thermus tengchongensis TaxID=1214928 RepID=UPI0009FDA61E|nr:M48 family metallopeptidase [Thermus tengchongensis]